METYLVGGCEIYHNLKLSDNKIKSTTWFQHEPQRASFSFFYFSNPENSDQLGSNVMYTRLLWAMNAAEEHEAFTLGGIYTEEIIAITKNGITVFTGYIDVTQSKINEDYGRADFVIYDAVKVISLLSGKVPYGQYSFGDFLNGSLELAGEARSIKKELEDKRFADIDIAFTGNLLDQLVTEYLFERTKVFFTQNWNLSNGQNKRVGFYTYTETRTGISYSHIFFIYFGIYRIGFRLLKDIKIFEIVNGYCPVDILYENNDNISYNSAEDADEDLQNQVDIEILAINRSIPEWGEWFFFNNIATAVIGINGYDYSFIHSDIFYERSVAVTGNIFPSLLSTGDNSKTHKIFQSVGAPYLPRPNYSNKSYIDTLKDFLIGNNLVMKVTVLGNIEITNIDDSNPLMVDDYMNKLERAVIINKSFEGFKAIDGDTELIDENFVDYYKQYLKSTSQYDYSIRKDAGTINAGDKVSYDSNNYLILTVSGDPESIDYTGIAVRL